jgi:hypothetical protein
VLWRREKYLGSAGNRIQFLGRTAYRLVTVLTELSWLAVYPYEDEAAMLKGRRLED